MNDYQLTLPCDVGKVSDGYHTFNELYEHRCLLFINLVMANQKHAFKTKRDQNKEKWESWFILGMRTPYGQITYHIPKYYWSLVDVEVIDHNAEYDGHTAADVLTRLIDMARDASKGQP